MTVDAEGSADLATNSTTRNPSLWVSSDSIAISVSPCTCVWPAGATRTKRLSEGSGPGGAALLRAIRALGAPSARRDTGVNG